MKKKHALNSGLGEVMSMVTDIALGLFLQNKNRLDIAKLREDDEDITGGYIMEYKHGDNAKNEPEINCTM